MWKRWWLITIPFDVSEIERVLYRYKDIIARVALHYLGNWTDTEDMVQEVILKWIESAPVFKDEEHEKSWFIRVTINLSKNKVWYCQEWLTHFPQGFCRLCSILQWFIVSLTLNHWRKASIGWADPAVVPVTDEVSPDDCLKLMRGHCFRIIAII